MNTQLAKHNQQIHLQDVSQNQWTFNIRRKWYLTLPLFQSQSRLTDWLLSFHPLFLTAVINNVNGPLLLGLPPADVSKFNHNYYPLPLTYKPKNIHESQRNYWKTFLVHKKKIYIYTDFLLTNFEETTKKKKKLLFSQTQETAHFLQNPAKNHKEMLRGPHKKISATETQKLSIFNSFQFFCFYVPRSFRT